MNMIRSLRFLLLVSFFVGSLSAIGQEIAVQGQVTDESNLPLPGVSIIVSGTTNGTTTDFDGNYTINAENGQELVFNFIGYLDQTISVNGTELNVSMKPNTQALDEIIVVGYGTMKKSDLTGAVSSVDGNDLTKIATNRPIEGIQGRVAGLSVMKSSGAPGAGLKVRIRGVGSTNNSDPLYVIDGVPMGNDMEHVAPEDIKSIEVLKDASSTAIYGSRGANGVIIVTTKSGSVDTKPRFSFNTYYGVGDVSNQVDMLNASQQGSLILEAAANDGISLPSNLESRINYVVANNSVGTNWQDEIFRTGVQQNYNLSVRGGFKVGENNDRKLTYSLSGTYFDEKGVVENTGFKKYMLNSRTEYQFNKNVTYGLQLNLFHKENGDFPQGLYGGPIPLSLSTSPMDSPYDLDGNLVETPTAFGQNPMLVVDHMQYPLNETNSYGLRTWLDVVIVDGLKFTTNFQYSKGASIRKDFRPQYYLNENFYRSQSELYEGRSDWTDYTWINLLNYNKTLGGKHNLNLTLGHEAAYNVSTGFGGTGFNVPGMEEYLRYLNLASEYSETLSSWQGQNGRTSYFARAFYSYDSKYMITGTVRYDGSSKFSGDNKWGMFPSVGVSWRASEEKFIQDLKVFSDLKLRAGWGRVGNQASAQGGSDAANIGNYDMYYVFNDQAYKGGITTNIPTPDLRWEIVETVNFGLDFGFFENKLKFTADYFIKDTKDMITRVALPGYYPKDRPNANIGTMNNKGFEFSLSYGKTSGEFNWNVGGNIALIKNNIASLNAEEDAFLDGGYIDKLGYTTRTSAGKEIAYFYGYQTDGIFRTQEEIDAHLSSDGSLIQPNAKIGDVRFLDNNDNGMIDADDRAYLGSGTPDFSYGLFFSADYKGFDLSANFNGVYGSEIVNGMGIFTLEVKDYTNAYASRMDRFHPVNNPNGTEPRVTLSDNNNNTQFSDRYVENGSFIRLKNLQFGYTLPKAFTQKANIDKLRFYVSGQNVFTVTEYKGFDPEIGDLTHDASSDVQSLGIGVDLGNYPQPRLLMLGANINF